jgi:hypothetical protein
MRMPTDSAAMRRPSQFRALRRGTSRFQTRKTQAGRGFRRPERQRARRHLESFGSAACPLGHRGPVPDALRDYTEQLLRRASPLRLRSAYPRRERFLSELCRQGLGGAPPHARRITLPNQVRPATPSWTAPIRERKARSCHRLPAERSATAWPHSSVLGRLGCDCVPDRLGVLVT